LKLTLDCIGYSIDFPKDKNTISNLFFFTAVILDLINNLAVRFSQQNPMPFTPFLNKDFLLHSKSARLLYHDNAAESPVGEPFRLLILD